MSYDITTNAPAGTLPAGSLPKSLSAGENSRRVWVFSVNEPKAPKISPVRGRRFATVF